MRKVLSVLLMVVMVCSLFVASAATTSPAAGDIKPGTSSPSTGDITKPGTSSPSTGDVTKPVASPTVDAITSASLADFYGAYALEGDDLMDALNSFTGFYIISTINEDGTPLAGFFIYGCVSYEGKYYLQFGLADNATRANLVRTGECVAVYAAAPADMPYATTGARMWAKMVTDEDLLAKLNTANSDTVLFFEIVEVRSLG